MTIGSIYYDHIQISESSQMLKGRLQFFQELLHFDLVDQPIEIYVQPQAGSSPQHHERILKNIKEEHYYSPVDSALDLTRFFMLEYKMPITFHDRKKIKVPIQTKQNQVYDSVGLVASPTAVATRTRWDATSTSAVHFFFFPTDMKETDQQELLQAAGTMFTHVHGGTFYTEIN